ncbi:lysophospholipid acyltransferase family protein [Marinirhabdus gelatinilytica]|nr:lysophospholipid acyltransferase family protein [Marinirhabdus gelatinilytica]
MQRLVYILVYPIIWIISKLPFWALYGVSDILFSFVYYLVGYRKKVVAENLKLALPHISEKERNDIRKEFYVHLCDMVLESIKSLSITEKEMKKRFTISNINTVLELEKENRNIMMFMGHYASWEWSVVLQRFVNHRGYAVYKRIENEYFDKLVKKIRARYNSQLINTKETVHKMGAAISRGELSIFAFIADQTAKHWKAKHFQEFMGIKVPVLTGGEMLAKKFDMAVIYLDVRKVKRGHYAADVKLITKNPKDYPDYEITDKFLTMVEDQIKAEPAYYLWTHKRWKYRDKVKDYE